MPADSPTVRRRELGATLRSLRADAGLTADQVAGLLGFSPSKLSRLENGRRGADQEDIRGLCELYQVDNKQQARLLTLAAEGKQRGWWQSVGRSYANYIGLEAAATSISDYGLAIVPGLLQTPEYARVMVRGRSPERAPSVVEERVRGRIARQRLLSSETAPAFEAVLDESVLHRVVGSPAVMAGQLAQLLEMSRLPAVTIRVVPFGAGSVPSGVNKFIILKFAPPDVPDLVFIEDLTGDRYLEQPDEVAIYTATFRALTDLAVDPATTRNMITAKLTDHMPKGSSLPSDT